MTTTSMSCGGETDSHSFSLPSLFSHPFFLSLDLPHHSQHERQINDYVNDGFDAFDK